jgi:hypothetical protein
MTGQYKSRRGGKRGSYDVNLRFFMYNEISVSFIARLTYKGNVFYYHYRYRPGSSESPG